MKFFWKDAEEYSSMPPMQKTEKERRNHATVDRTPRRPGLSIDSLTECSCYIEKQ